MSAKANISQVKWRRLQDALKAALGDDTPAVPEIAGVLQFDGERKISQMSKVRWAAMAAIVETHARARGAPTPVDVPALLDSLRAILGFDERASTYTPEQAQAVKNWIARRKAETGLPGYVVTGEQRRRKEAFALRREALLKANAPPRVQTAESLSTEVAKTRAA